MIGPALRAILLADSEIAGMVGERMYPQVAPQGAPMPALVYSTRKEPLTVQEGLQGFDRWDVGIDCWSRAREGVAPYDEAKALSEAVVRVLGGYRGATAGMQIHSVIVDGIYDDMADEETGLYSVGVDAVIWAQKAP